MPGGRIDPIPRGLSRASRKGSERETKYQAARGGSHGTESMKSEIRIRIKSRKRIKSKSRIRSRTGVVCDPWG
jgi:hypothetical protein